MKVCPNCGATLRDVARFCNRCGAVQPSDAEIVPSAVLAQDAEEVLDSPTSAPPGGALGVHDTERSNGRVPRPSRVPRHRDEEASLPTGETDSGGESGDTSPDAVVITSELPTTETESEPQPESAPAADAPSQTEDEAPTANGEGQTANADGADDAPTVPLSGRAASSAVLPSDWTEAETQEYATLAAAGIAPELPNVDIGDESALPDDLPWPLPVSLIVGGRYRVEALVQSEAAGPDAENVYRVTDLQGYERCWSCGTEYGATAASDRYCRECGADMLSRDYLLYERAEVPSEQQLGEDDATTAQTQSHDGAQAEADIRTFAQRGRAYRVVAREAEPPRFPLGARIAVASATDVGQTRMGERNEDSSGTFSLTLNFDSHAQPVALAVVADGLGGHANGQDASRLVVRTVIEHVIRSVTLPFLGMPADGQATIEGMEHILTEAARAANTALYAANEESQADMGATLVAALLYGESACVANLGDSRGYVYDEAGLRRITTDHSLVEQLISGGLIQPEERYTHPQRNQIFRSIGNDAEIEVDMFVQRLAPGMRLLLCSDGLWEMVRDDEIAHILAETPDLQQACDALVAAANANGGEDNITAVLVAIDG